MTTATTAPKTIATLGLYNPANGKTYTYKGFIPTNRISQNCTNDSHTTCTGGPSDLLMYLGFEFTKKMCCLCTCHFEKAGN
jgi:hypothetical protein